MKTGSVIFIFLLLQVSVFGKKGKKDTFESGEDQGPGEEVDNDEDNNLFSIPNHTFLFHPHTWRSGAKAGQTDYWVTLSAPPYEFTRKTNTDGDGTCKCICKGCRNLGEYVSCRVFNTVTDPDDSRKGRFNFVLLRILRHWLNICDLTSHLRLKH